MFELIAGLARKLFAPWGNETTGPAVTRRSILASLPVLTRSLITLGGAGLILHLLGTKTRAWLGRPPQEEKGNALNPAMPQTKAQTQLDRYRLPRHVMPTRYELRLTPDLAASTFAGIETVTLTVKKATADIVLNAVELEITEASIEPGGSKNGPPRKAMVEPDAALERVRLRFSATISPGTWTLHLTFKGTLNDKLRGFYRSTYQDQAGQTQVLAATQFEATDARRAFPCWDEPDFKAVFASTLAIDPALTAVSNTAIASERTEQGRKILQFRDTIRMSTYLVAFVVGKLEASEPVSVGKTPLRVWAVPGKGKLSAFGREIGAFSLRFFEEYYGLAYPGDKLDLLAIPDFASGAMENLGAITFRETALLVDEQTATHAELERVADVVAHENAHMWFGDLVTMSWWNGLWLNEAFATFMEMLAVDVWKPEWQRWTSFGVSRAAALSVDGLRSSRPIEFPVLAPRDADAMFDVLTYEKGASVLRMLEQHIGPEVFRDGVRRYLRDHAYGNADTKDLWVALGKAARQPIPELMNGWIFQPGYPLISVTLDGGYLRLSQRHFTYLSDVAKPGTSKGAKPTKTKAQRWEVPLQVRVTTQGQSRTHKVLLKGPTTKLKLAAGFDSVLVNEGGHGFYRVHYAPDLLKRLLPQAAAPRLTAIERFNLANDAWAATVAGLMPLAEYVTLTERFRKERDRNVWALLIESFHMLNRIIQPADRPGLEALVRDRIGPVWAELGWAPNPGEDDLTKQLRSDLLRAQGTIGHDDAVQARAAELYAQSLAQPSSVDPNILPALIAILAQTGDRTRYEEFLSRFHKAATPQEERRYLYALAAFRPVSLLEQTLTLALNGGIRTQDAPFIIRLVLSNVYGREQAWDFVKANWEALDKRFPKQGIRRMLEGITGLATPELERDVHRFLAEQKVDLGGKTLEQYLEQLRIAVAFRQREAATLTHLFPA